MSLNSVNIMGNLTRDPELKYTPSGKSVCSLSIANNRVYTSKGEKTTVEVWGAAAENCCKYLTKGSGIIVEGRLRQDRWGKDGKTKSRVRIIANNIHFMPKKTGAAPASRQQPAEPEHSEPAQPAQPADAVAWDE